MVAVGTAHDGLNALVIEAALLIFRLQVAQRLLAGHRENHFLDRPVRAFQRCGSHLKEQLVFPLHPLDVFQDFFVHRALSARSHLVDDAQQELDELIGDLLTADQAKSGQQRIADFRRMAADLRHVLDRDPPLALEEPFPGNTSEQVGGQG